MDWVERYNLWLREDWERKNEERSDGLFHCSDLGGCIRKAIFRRAGIRIMPDDGRLRRLRQGTIVHTDYAEAAKGAPDVYTETDLTQYLPEGWAGTCDAICTAGPGLIADYKTVRPDAFRFAGEWPKTYDCLQVGAYWVAAERKFERAIEVAEVIYIPLGDFGEPKACRIEPYWRENALRMMAVYDEAWERYQRDEVLPPTLPPVYKETKKDPGWKQAWECNPAYCDYRSGDYCEGGAETP